jgi:hypothetical protein
MVAAEIWGVSVDEVLGRIEAGQVPSKTEYGFLVVDMAPDGPRLAPCGNVVGERPPTFVIAPDGDEFADEEDAPALVLAGGPADEGQLEDGAPLDWRRHRLAASRKRRAPLREALVLRHPQNDG